MTGESVGVTYVPKNIFVILDSGLLMGETTPGAAVLVAAGVAVAVCADVLAFEVDVLDEAAGLALLHPVAKSKVADNIKINFFM